MDQYQICASTNLGQYIISPQEGVAYLQDPPLMDLQLGSQLQTTVMHETLQIEVWDGGNCLIMWQLNTGGKTYL